ncbi:MAG: hypothetical protein U5L03_15325 [Burkholderiaceae bacterium]|nr:hypothetical protein [Burkholderiaceae bacterium]
MLLAACATEPKAPTPQLSGPSATRIYLPAVLGIPLAILAPELPAGSIAAGERARFEIAFSIDLRGAVAESAMQSTTRPDLADAMLAQHRQWVYAVATSASGPCSIARFRGLQTIEVERVDGKLVASGEPAQVVEVLAAVDARDVVTDPSSVPNYRSILNSIVYPRSALVEGVERSLSMIVVFGTNGSVKDAFPIYDAYDQYGFGPSALRAVRQLKMEPPPPRDLTTCVPINFRIR